MIVTAKTRAFNQGNKNTGIHRELRVGILARVFPGNRSMLLIGRGRNPPLIPRPPPSAGQACKGGDCGA